MTEKKGKSDDDKVEGKVKGKKDDNEKTKGKLKTRMTTFIDIRSEAQKILDGKGI